VFGTIIVAALLTGLVSSVLTAPFGDNYAAGSIVAAIASPITMPCMARWVCSSTSTCESEMERYSAADLERDSASNPG